MIMRENIGKYMQELKQWLEETSDERPEEMSGFFSRRLDIYEEHMSVWAAAYEKFSRLLPAECVEILDLGCGTGLELDEIFKKNPCLKVTGVDLCQDMLELLLKKHGDRQLELVCQDYFDYDMAQERWDVIISFESLHHFLPDKKQMLYEKIYKGLKKNAIFISGDYMACCEEEEMLLQTAYKEKRARFQIPADQFIHFDIPLTPAHEMTLLRAAGFEHIHIVDCINGATLLYSKKYCHTVS